MFARQDAVDFSFRMLSPLENETCMLQQEWLLGVCAMGAKSASVFCFVLVPGMGVPLACFFLLDVFEENVFNSNPQFCLPCICLSLKLFGKLFLHYLAEVFLFLLVVPSITICQRR